MANDLGRFGLAIALIALIASGLYELGGTVSASRPGNGPILFLPPLR